MFFTHPVTAASNGLMHWNFSEHLKHNTHMTIGSDWGVPELPAPFPAMAGIVESVGGGDRKKGAEVLLRCLTLSGAEAVGRGKETGSIEVGKEATFIVVDKDLSKGEFDGAKVLKTWFEGEVVWDSAPVPGFD
jgi:predicted amidohydrolase YtcJ